MGDDPRASAREVSDEPEIHTGDEKIGLIVLGMLGLIILTGTGWAIGVNNQLAAQERVVNEKWAQVQNVYGRRAELVSSLMETVKGVAPQESAMLEEVKAQVSVVQPQGKARADRRSRGFPEVPAAATAAGRSPGPAPGCRRAIPSLHGWLWGAAALLGTPVGVRLRRLLRGD